MRWLVAIAVAVLVLAGCGTSTAGDPDPVPTLPTVASTTTTTTEPDVAAEGCKDPTENADVLVSSSNDRISEAARRYREARSQALFGGGSEAMGREATAAVDLMLACEAAGYR